MHPICFPLKNTQIESLPPILVPTTPYLFSLGYCESLPSRTPASTPAPLQSVSTAGRYIWSEPNPHFLVRPNVLGSCSSPTFLPFAPLAMWALCSFSTVTNILCPYQASAWTALPSNARWLVPLLMQSLPMWFQMKPSFPDCLSPSLAYLCPLPVYVSSMTLQPLDMSKCPFASYLSVYPLRKTGALVLSTSGSPAFQQSLALQELKGLNEWVNSRRNELCSPMTTSVLLIS